MKRRKEEKKLVSTSLTVRQATLTSECESKTIISLGLKKLFQKVENKLGFLANYKNSLIKVFL